MYMWYLLQIYRFLNRFILIGRCILILIGYLKYEFNSIMKYQYMYFCFLVYKYIYNKDWELLFIYLKFVGNIF